MASSERPLRDGKLRLSAGCTLCLLLISACQLETSPSTVVPAQAVDASAPITLKPDTGARDAAILSPPPPVTQPPPAATPSSSGASSQPQQPDAGSLMGAALDAALGPDPKDAGVYTDAAQPDDAGTKPPIVVVDAGKDMGKDMGKDAGACGGPCPAALPHCSKKHTCVACEDNKDCKGSAASRCEPSTQSCVECVTAADCDDDAPACDPITHACVGCLSQADCDADDGTLCDVATHRCVECKTDGDCTDPASARCDNGECTPCSASAQCAHITGALVCAVAGNNSRSGTCVECAAHSDCKNPAKPQCSDRHCVACTSDDACKGRQGTSVCDDGQEHGGRHRGSVSTGACVECTPQDDNACGQRVCDSIQKRCTQRARASAGLCQPCVSDNECSNGRMCGTLDTTSPTAASYCVGQSAGESCLRACEAGVPIACALDF